MSTPPKEEMEDLVKNESMMSYLYRSAKVKTRLRELELQNHQPERWDNVTFSKRKLFPATPLGDIDASLDEKNKPNTSQASLHSKSDKEDLSVLYRCKTSGIESCAEVSKELTFRQHWSPNHPVYFAKIRIRNNWNGQIAYKVVPSHLDKLWLNEHCGILPQRSSTQVSICTNPMVPYKYVDISYESVKVLVTPVKLKKKEPEEKLHQVKELSAFWFEWEKNPSLKHAPGTTHTISTILPYDTAYLLEESEFWFMNARAKTAIWIRNCRPIDRIKNFSNVIRHFVSTDFDTSKGTMIRFVEGDGRQNRNGTVTTFKSEQLKFKMKLIKFIILAMYLYVILCTPPATIIKKSLDELIGKCSVNSTF